MKCISLWQPWASLVVCGQKKIETRSWETLHRGPILIHAAKRWALCEQNFAGRILRERDLITTLGRPSDLPRGMIVGCVEIVSVEHIDFGTEYPDVREQELGHYALGRYMWRLKNPQRFKSPIPWRGRQRIFNVDDAGVDAALRWAEGKS